MNTRSRMILMWIGGTGIATLMLCGIHSLPGFGRYPGPYGDVINSAAPFERRITNVVAAVNFDYRALDTLGEEFILFGAVAGVLLLLRGSRGESLDAPPELAPIGRAMETRSDAISWFSCVLVVFINLFGTYMVLHGNLTPGGGFQGGAILGTASMLVYVGTGYRAYRKTTPKKLVELVEAIAASGYSLVGIGAMIAGEAFLKRDRVPRGDAVFHLCTDSFGELSHRRRLSDLSGERSSAGDACGRSRWPRAGTHGYRGRRNRHGFVARSGDTGLQTARDSRSAPAQADGGLAECRASPPWLSPSR
jgi:multicomponent Na+:H+ antiporter subunit B